MNTIKKINFIIGLFYSIACIQASGGKTVNVIKPLAKAGVVGAKILVTPTATEAYHHYIDAHPINATQNQPQPQKHSGQPYQLKNNKVTATPANTIKNNEFNDSSPVTQKKALTVDTNKAFNNTNISLPQKIAPTNQLQNSDSNKLNNSIIKPKAQQPVQPLTLPPYLSSSSLGGRFAFKGIPRTQAKPRPDQLQLTYDEGYKNPIEKAIKPTLKRKNKEEKNISKIDIDETISTPQTIEPVSENKNAPVKQSKKINLRPQESAVMQEPQETEQRFNINKMYVEGKVKDISQFVEDWDYYRNDFNNEKSHGNMLQEQILTSLNIKNKQGKLQVFDAVTDFKIIDILSKKYKHHKNAIRVFQATRDTIQHQFTSQQTTPRQANSVIAYYYNKNRANDVFVFMNKKPIINQENKMITNMPSVEEIIDKALQTPTEQAYKALKATLKATNIAIYASRADQSFFGDGSLLTQLKNFEKRINRTLQDSNMTQFQSWGSYANQALSSAGSSAFHATIGKMPISTALNLSKTVADQISPYANGLMNLSGVKKMTLSQVAEKAGLSQKEVPDGENNPIRPVAPQKSSVKNTLNFDMDTQVLNEFTIKNKVNKIVGEYYTPAMQHDIMIATGINPKTRPSVENIIEQALKTPSQQTFNALQATLEATKVALYAHRSEKSMFNTSKSYQQLEVLEQQVMQALKQPQFTPFHSWTSRATSYATSFIPSVKTVLDTTSLGSMTIEQALKGMDLAGKIAQPVINYSGVSNMTVSQGLTAAGITN